MHVVKSSELDFVPASHENPDNPGVLKKVLATNEDLMFGQVQMVNWANLPVGSSFQMHYHEDMQEIFVLLNGRARMTVDDQTVELNPGDAIVVDPREIHSMTNDCEEVVQYVVFGISTQQGGQTIVVD